MAFKKGGLGKGLDALLIDNSAEENSTASAVKLKIMDIEPNRDQARKDFDEKALSELADSIAKYGVLQPLLVRPLTDGGYQLIAGERRWRASRLAGLTEVPVVIREMTDEEASALSLIENLQREDLNPIEEALGLNSLMKDFGLTQEETAERVGKSRPTVANALRLLNLPDSILDLVRNGKVSSGHARALLSLSSEAQMLEIAELICKKGISVRETERLAKAYSKEKKEKTEKASRREHFYDEVELALTQSLCRKIKVQNNKNETGTLEIAFNSKEDLERIAQALSSLE
ncbi:MAG: ParB/RepB/Spo0J family partition protein [Clostridia bacterium]|nr:ParB/RepB/Spo0J family partition protein [Clostridia bacterium]